MPNLKLCDVATQFLATNEIAYRHGDFYLFKNGCYETLSPDELQSLVARCILTHYGSNELTPTVVSSAVKIIEMLTLQRGQCQPFWKSKSSDVASVLVLRNGVLDMEPMYAGDDPVLIPHTSDLFAMGSVGYDYDPEARCDLFDEFMEWFSSGDPDVELLLLQFYAYCLLRDLEFQRFLILLGQGDNGKSVYLGTLTRLVGEFNCSALPFERFSGRFDFAALIDKAVNIAGDANEISKVAEGNLRMLSDGASSLVTVERKYHEAFKTRNRARLVFAANISPRWRDRTNALWRRMLLIPCMARVEEKVRKLETQFDMSGVLNRVIAAGARLIADGDFIVPTVVSSAVTSERHDANPSAQFFTEHVVVSADAFVPMRRLYQSYNDWAKACGYLPLARNNFGKEVRTHFADQIRAGTISAGKGKSQPRENGYYGIDYAPQGQEAYFAAKQAEIERKAKLADPATPIKEKREIEKVETVKRKLDDLGKPGESVASDDDEALTKELIGDDE